MNTFIRQSNRVLLSAVFALGVVVALTQLNHAYAASVVTDCPNTVGTIGTGANCDRTGSYLTTTDCLLGNDANGNPYCCDYQYRV